MDWYNLGHMHISEYGLYGLQTGLGASDWEWDRSCGLVRGSFQDSFILFVLLCYFSIANDTTLLITIV